SPGSSPPPSSSSTPNFSGSSSAPLNSSPCPQCSSLCALYIEISSIQIKLTVRLRLRCARISPSHVRQLVAFPPTTQVSFRRNPHFHFRNRCLLDGPGKQTLDRPPG